MKQLLLQRFYSNITFDENTGCWDVRGHKDATGYSIFKISNTNMKMHRVSYFIHRGMIPNNLDLDHLCRNGGCVNPAHLEPVTKKENSRRGLTGLVTGARQMLKTHCPYGHEYTPENTRYDLCDRRVCKMCDNARCRAYYKKTYKKQNSVDRETNE